MIEDVEKPDNDNTDLDNTGKSSSDFTSAVYMITLSGLSVTLFVFCNVSRAKKHFELFHKHV